MYNVIFTNMKDKEIEIKHDHDEHDDDHIEWQICCSHSSKGFIKYIITVLISIITLVFAIYMIAS